MKNTINWETIEELEKDYLNLSKEIYKLKQKRKSILKSVGKAILNRKKSKCLLCANLGLEFDEQGIVHSCNCKN